MPYSVSFDSERNIVNVCVSGLASKEDHFAARDEALLLCKENNCTKLLVDLHELNTSNISTLGCFKFGERLAETSPTVQIAHILPIDNRAKMDVKFTADVEANRGRPNGVFETIEEARRWLQGIT